MRANLSRRLLLWAGLPATVLFGAVVAIATLRSQQRLIHETEQVARSMAEFHASRIDQRLSRASQIPEDMVLALERGLLTTKPDLESYLHEMIVRNPAIYGSCLAFEPRSFDHEQQLYAPYWYRHDGEPQYEQLGKPEYNYLDEKWEWYARPRREGVPIWTEPYFDEGGGNVVMTTYSVPFFRESRQLWGIATIDIAITQLMNEVSRLEVGETGYCFLVTKHGGFLAYPDRAEIMKSSIQAHDPELARRMIAGEHGFLRRMDPYRNQAAWIAFTPIRAGEFSLAVVYPEAEVLSAAHRLQRELLLAGGLGLLALYGALFVVSRSISRPITQLAQAARRIAGGELDQDVRLNAKTEEVQQLATAFSKMTKDLKMRMEELRYTTLVNERIEGELSAARSIQMSLVAKTFPAFPDRPEIDVHAIIKPARQVGGDFYDFYFVGEDHLCLVVADVAGKGVPAALYMSVCKTLLRANVALTSSPTELLAKVNRDLCEQGNDSGMFVSLLLALLDVRTGELVLGSAGHPPPLRLTAEGTTEILPLRTGVALGAWRDCTYTTTRHQLSLGDTLVFYTDGVTEALDDTRHFYSAPRLQRVLTSLQGARAKTIAQTVLQDVRTFAAHQEQADDLTLLTVRWLGPLAHEQQAEPETALLAS